MVLLEPKRIHIVDRLNPFFLVRSGLARSGQRESEGLPAADNLIFPSPNPISYCRFKNIDIYILERPELNAISAHTRLA